MFANTMILKGEELQHVLHQRQLLGSVYVQAKNTKDNDGIVIILIRCQ